MYFPLTYSSFTSNATASASAAPFIHLSIDAWKLFEFDDLLWQLSESTLTFLKRPDCRESRLRARNASIIWPFSQHSTSVSSSWKRIKVPPTTGPRLHVQAGCLPTPYYTYPSRYTRTYVLIRELFSCEIGSQNFSSAQLGLLKNLKQVEVDNCRRLLDFIIQVL